MHTQLEPRLCVGDAETARQLFGAGKSKESVGKSTTVAVQDHQCSAGLTSQQDRYERGTLARSRAILIFCTGHTEAVVTIVKQLARFERLQ